MRIRLRTLKLNCRKSEEVVDLTASISFFHGRLSAGKSTIARLIDFCLGASFEQTTALQQEMVSAQLTGEMGGKDVLIERNKGENFLQVSWSGPEVSPNSVLVAAKGDGPAVAADNIRNLSDLIFHLLGIPVIKVRKRTDDPDSSLIRLSFRDIMTFCYLPQEDLDSSFFLLQTPIRREKSKDALNYVLGFFSERLNELQIDYDHAATEQRTKELSARRITEFLAQFEFGSEADIDLELASITTQSAEIEATLDQSRTSFLRDTHFTDEKRRVLSQLSRNLSQAQEALADIAQRSGEQKELRAELISMKFKTARADSARDVLAGARFAVCPNCGQPLSTHRVRLPSECYVCLQPPKPTDAALNIGIVRSDLDARIQEIDTYLRRQERAESELERQVAKLRQEKQALDAELAELLTSYETDRLVRSRDAERQRATLVERRSFLERLRELPNAVRKMAEEAEALKGRLGTIEREIENEKRRLTAADDNFKLLEDFFLEALIEIGLPGISDSDKVRINRRTMLAEILPAGDEALAYSFFNAGSGGKKVLITICFALALHRTAAVRSLPLPNFLMIDSPTKNITPDINPQLVSAFYTYLYRLCSTDLRGLQVIIIDQTLVKPDPELDLSFRERLMQSGDREHPPLISYYDGP